MKHKMHLNNEPFDRIKDGTKTVELRLNDEKRQQLQEKDLIEFTNRITGETIITKIVGLYKYSNFEELYKHFDEVSYGYDQDMEQYYSKEEQEKYGVVGIMIEVIKSNE